MHTHSNPGSFASRSSTVLFFGAVLSLWMIHATVMAQVNVTVNVTPPYSTKLSDYSSNPSKVLATLLNVTPDQQPLQVYLRGEITSDGGIRIFTRPGYKPAIPITLMPGSVYIVNQNNLGLMFNAEQLVYQGITQQDIVYGNGLPEDVYTLCIRVYDFATDMPLSDEAPSGCSAPFAVVSLEPPVILQPFCHDSVTLLSPQNLIFTWTRPAGTPMSVRYRFRMVEMNMSGQDPAEAMHSAPSPWFYETVISTNLLIYSAAQPMLVPGKSYTFTVQVFDPLGQLKFRNEGISEVCSFTCRIPSGPTILIPGGALGETKKDLELVPQTVVQGKLLCKYPNSPHDPVIDVSAALQKMQQKSTVTLPGTGIPGSTSGSGTGTGTTGTSNLTGTGVNYNLVTQITSQITGNAGYHNYGYLNPPVTGMDNGAPQELNDYGLPLIQSMRSRKYIFENSETLQHTKPLANTQVRLVARVAYMSMPGSFGVLHPSYGETSPVMMGLDLKGAFGTNVMHVINVVLDVTTTDAQGNYTFSFRAPFFTGPVIGTDIEHTPIYDNQIDIKGDILGGIMQQVVFPGVDLMSNIGVMNNMAGQNIGGQAVGGGGQQKVMMGGINATDRHGYVCLKVEVVNQKFCSPDLDLFIMPGDQIELPVQVAKLKTYNLLVEVKSDGTPNQLNTPNAPLAGVMVSILRDQKKVPLETPLILDYEGQRPGTQTSNTNGTFRNVSAAHTNDSGRVYFSNLVRHAYINPQYLIELSTRDFSIASTDYDYTLFNYQNTFKTLATTDDNKAIMVPAGRALYNFQYQKPTEVVFRYTLKPLPPEIKGRVMAQSNIENIGLEGARTELLNQKYSTKFADYASFINSCYGSKEQSQPTNPAGFFRYEKLPLDVDNSNGQVEGPYRRVYIQYPGYKTVVIPPIDQLPYKLLNGQLKDVKDINLEPLKIFKGYVEDEEGNPVVCYVKSAYSPYYKTEKKIVTFNPKDPSKTVYQEEFRVPAAEGGNNTLLTITPLSSQYFPRDTSALFTNASLKVVVYKRLHRPAIKITNLQGTPLPGVTVEVGTEKGVTDAQGMVWLKFAAAADQFVLKITPGSGYAPLQQSLNVPVTSAWMHFTFALQESKHIKGYITEAVSKQPVEGALVFAELVVTGGTKLYLEATSNASGYYKLKGIPKSLATLTVHVVKGGAAPSYAGTEGTITFPASGASPTQDQNFTVTSIAGWDLSSILGFPMVAKSFQPLKVSPGNPERATLSGYLINPPPHFSYDLLQQDLKIPFGPVTVIKSAEKRAVPESDEMVLETLEIPIEVGNTYYGYLTQRTPSAGSAPGMGWGGINLPPGNSRLKLAKTIGSATSGHVTGHLRLDLASFKTAHDFSGILYISDDLTGGKTMVFSSSPTTFSLSRRYITSLNAQLQPVAVKNYRAFGFAASAIPDSSTISGGTIRMNTILHTEIPGCGTCGTLDLKIRAGELVINGTNLNFQPLAGQQLSFELENWKIYSQKPWHFDINEGAIVLPEVLIVTGQGIDAKVKGMKVRPKSLSEGTIDMGSGGLTLGGVATVKLSGSLKPLFHYDQGIGHYRISLVGETNKPAGWVENLPNTSPKKLEFASIGLLSNSKDVLTIGQSFRFYDIIDMYVDQLMTGPGFFKLNGQPEIGIPGYDPPSAVVTYSRNASNNLVCRVEPLQGYVNCNGNVEFILDLDRQTTSNGSFTAYGDVKIKPAAGESGSPVMLRGFLTKTKNACNFQIIKVDALTKRYHGSEMQTMISGSNTLLVREGSAVVTGQKWGFLEYTGLTTQINGLTDSAGNPNALKFKVYGGIDVSSEDVSVSNISTPLGGLKLVYNFADGSMMGTLTMKHIPLGYAYITSGLATMRFNQKGYYLLLNMQDFALGPNPGMPGFRGGIVIGNTTGVVASDITGLQQSFRKNLPDFAQTGLKGLYLVGEKVLVNEEIDLKFTAIAARAGLGIYVNANFIKEPELLVGGYGYLELDGSMSWEIPKTGPSCGAGINTQLNFDVHGGYKQGNFVMNNCGAIQVKPYVTGSCGVVLNKIGLGELLEVISNKISIKTEFGVNGSDFYMTLEPFETCL
jgi:TANFOR domain-containing protein